MGSGAGDRIAGPIFRTIMYDNRGTGRSDKPAIKYSLEMFAGDAIALLDALKIERAHVFGVSMGGMIAQELALQHASRLQTLTLGCTTCGGKHAVPPPPESLKTADGAARGASAGGTDSPGVAAAISARNISSIIVRNWRRRFRGCWHIRRRRRPICAIWRRLTGSRPMTGCRKSRRRRWW